MTVSILIYIQVNDSHSAATAMTTISAWPVQAGPRPWPHVFVSWSRSWPGWRRFPAIWWRRAAGSSSFASCGCSSGSGPSSPMASAAARKMLSSSIYNNNNNNTRGRMFTFSTYIAQYPEWITLQADGQVGNSQ